MLLIKEKMKFIGMFLKLKEFKRVISYIMKFLQEKQFVRFSENPESLVFILRFGVGSA